MKRVVFCYSKNKIMIVLTVCACMWLSIPLCACKEKPYTFTDPIEYIDGVPICEWEMGYFQHRVLDGYYDFDDCAGIYAENYKGNKLCLFNADKNNMYTKHQSYYVMGKHDDKLYSYTSCVYYDEELGAPPKAAEKHSFACDIYIKPLAAEYDRNKLSFLFVKETSSECKFSHKFINIFMDGECFATFFFSTWVPVTQEWFENFLTERLVWGDSMEFEETDDEL